MVVYSFVVLCTMWHGCIIFQIGVWISWDISFQGTDINKWLCISTYSENSSNTGKNRGSLWCFWCSFLHFSHHTDTEHTASLRENYTKDCFSFFGSVWGLLFLEPVVFLTFKCPVCLSALKTEILLL